MKNLNKIILLTLMMLLSASSFAAQFTVKFKRPASWSATPHIHMWYDANTIANDQVMTAIAGQNGWFQYAVNTNESTVHIIFNNGGWGVDMSNQTNAYNNAAAADMCLSANGTDTDIYEVTCPTSGGSTGGGSTNTNGVTIRFKRPASWTNVPNIHIYQTVDDPVGPTPSFSNKTRVMYEINVLNYSQNGNFAAVTNDLARLKNLGVTTLWLMPIFPIGNEGRVGQYGSPYATKDFKAVNPTYGTLNDFKALVNKAHEMGMEVFLDIACNHTAKDHPWVKSNIDYYAWNNGQRPYSPYNWNDVYKLEYGNTNLQNAMIDALKYWVSECNIDGYRLDHASGVPLSFWQKARAEVDKIKKIYWLAEADKDASGLIAGFDGDYAWGFNDKLIEFTKHRTVSTLITECNALFYDNIYAQKNKMVYLTNHDLSAYNGTEFARFGDFYQPLMVLQFTIYDMPLLYNGQEYGISSTTFTDKQTINWNNKNNTIADLIAKLVSLRRSSAALQDGSLRGSLTNLGASAPTVYAYERKYGNSSVVVMLNFSTSASSFTLSTKPNGEYTDYLSGGKVNMNNQTSFSLPANGYKVYVK